MRAVTEQICDRGTAMVGAGIFGTFYQGDPRKPGATAICTTTTVAALKPGECQPVFCDWKNPPQGAQDVWFRANDDGKRAGVVSECDGDNDLLLLKGLMCFVPG